MTDQTIKVEPVAESEKPPLPKYMISWVDVITAGITVEDFPDVEAPMVKDVIDAFLIRLSNASATVAVNLEPEEGVSREKIDALIRFLLEPRIEVDGVVVRSEP